MGPGDWIVLLVVAGLAAGCVVRMHRRRGCGCGCGGCRGDCARCGKHGGYAK